MGDMELMKVTGDSETPVFPAIKCPARDCGFSICDWTTRTLLPGEKYKEFLDVLTMRNPLPPPERRRECILCFNTFLLSKLISLPCDCLICPDCIKGYLAVTIRIGTLVRFLTIPARR